ncbi:MAG: hypothetical protein A2Z17_05565 [Gammaproteobacteria bacterium RBG_16_66_13]|nr:MAG: hypothetical protein A2Z17_05565 [Gammaproteobacteria bacterium RBG_16_66_13]
MTAIVAVATWAPLQHFLERTVSVFPVLLAVLVVLVVGVALSWLLAWVVRTALERLGFDHVSRRPEIADALRRTSLRQSPSVLVGQVVRWVGVVLTLVGALSILSAEATDVVLASLVRYMPRLAAGLLLLVLGYAISTFVARSVLIWAVNSRLQGARWLAAGVRLLVGIFFLALALENLGFGRDIALVVLAILLGGGVFATALAFGLAGKDLARESLERMMREAREEDRDSLSHL